MSEDFNLPMRPASIKRDMLAHPTRTASGQYGLTVHHRGRVVLRVFDDRYTATDVLAWSRGFLLMTREVQ